MSQTAEQLRVVLANVFVLYFKAHSFHWNVQGPLFHSMHDFFGALYAQVFAEVDTTAEQIRALGELAPGSLLDLLVPTIPGEFAIPYEVSEMINQLLTLNELVLKSLYAAHDTAAEEQHDGVVNFIEGAIDAHAKIAWQLKAHVN
jgi:starvation-inducible DNA-binding protein